jgi:tRNA (cytidine56-2'-O)-methyltransferase
LYFIFIYRIHYDYTIVDGWLFTLIAVLRLGHRIDRDKRITTHVALVARAFGADQMYLTTKDHKMEETLQEVSERFGDGFHIETGVNLKQLLKQWKGITVHLTMYGEELEKSLHHIQKTQDILIIVGSEKVPSYIYHVADYNVSVGNQPHSEVAALALFLDRYTQGKWLGKRFKGNMEILPSPRGKKVVSTRKKR